MSSPFFFPCTCSPLYWTCPRGITYSSVSTKSSEYSVHGKQRDQRMLPLLTTFKKKVSCHCYLQYRCRGFYAPASSSASNSAELQRLPGSHRGFQRHENARPTRGFLEALDFGVHRVWHGTVFLGDHHGSHHPFRLLGAAGGRMRCCDHHQRTRWWRVSMQGKVRTQMHPDYPSLLVSQVTGWDYAMIITPSSRFSLL